MKKAYLKQSWISDKLEIRHSSIHGKGVFTKKPISKDEIVIIWGGEIVSIDDFKNGVGMKHTNVGISENSYLVASNQDGVSIDDFMNHSCDPNLWLNDEVTLSAMRNIKEEEELTFDYAIEIISDDYIMKNNCYCQSPNCRGVITGNDWKLKELQKTYGNHFSPFILERIKKEKI